MIKEFEVNVNKTRLDRFIVDNFDGASRSRIQKDIEAGKVTVNGHSVNEAKYTVRLADKVVYNFEEKKPIQPQELNIKAVFENEDILVINKEPGLVIHPAPGYKGVTLVEGLLHRYKEIALVGEDEVRPGIVHRLDKDTSGVMLVAKNQETFEHLKDAFATRAIKKEYIALVCGHVPSKHGFINTPIGKHLTDFRKMTTLRPKDAKEAITEYTTLEYLTNPLKSGQVDEYTLLRVNLHTGRTHQIRVHFQSIGFPLAGDSLYGKCKAPGLNRQFLHSQKIEVKMPDDTWIEAHAPIPDDLKLVLKNLNSQSDLE
jgi:23S rRNA pseudouridine1911/1915/1917 synthase